MSACVTVPHPFRHDGDVPPLTEPKALVPLSVAPIAAAPGLSDAVIKALEQEDLAATSLTGEDRFQRLRADVQPDKGVIVWTLGDLTGKPLDSFPTQIPPQPSDDPGWAKTAKYVAARLAKGLRSNGQSGGQNDQAVALPTLSVGDLAVPDGFDGKGLKRALESVLRSQGYGVTPTGGVFVIGGEVRISPLDGGRDLVQLSWRVQDSHGKPLGVVHQSNPVAHDVVTTDQASILRPIAEGAVEGVRTLVH
jgi:hypothetical protein